MNKLASVVAGRRSKFLVLALWLVVLGTGAPFASRFERVQKNEPSSFLPAGAESVRVLEIGKRFPSGQVTAAVVVFRDAAGLDPADRAAVEATRTSLNAAPPQGMLPVAAPALSPDGKAALLIAGIRAAGDDNLLQHAVEALRREARSRASPGLVVKVTGPAGYSDDGSRVFDGINSTLLLSTTLLVFVLLVLIYRSPIFWALPLAGVLFAESTVRALGYGLASAGVLINAMTAGILLVLVYGAGTDYALLLTARYREELRRHDDKHEAMRIAIRRAGPPILASSGTVVTALVCLSLAQTNTIAGMGPIAAVGVAVAACAMLTLLPALLLIGGPSGPSSPGSAAPARIGAGCGSGSGAGSSGGTAPWRWRRSSASAASPPESPPSTTTSRPPTRSAAASSRSPDSACSTSPSLPAPARPRSCSSATRRGSPPSAPRLQGRHRWLPSAPPRAAAPARASPSR
jgi:RND superfamily putative drug exporter